MKRSNIYLWVMILLVSTLLVSCGNKENITGKSTENNRKEGEETKLKAIQQGKLALANNDFKKAEANFKLAVNEGANSRDSREWYQLIENYMLINKAIDNRKIDHADKLIKQIQENPNYSSIKEKVLDKEKYLKKIKEIQNEIKNVQSQIEALNNNRPSEKLLNRIAKLQNETWLSKEEKKLIGGISAKIKEVQQEQSNNQVEQAPKHSQSKGLSFDSMRNIAQKYVNDWNGYDNQLKDEYWEEIDGKNVRFFIFCDGPTDHIIGLYINPKSGAVTKDSGMY